MFEREDGVIVNVVSVAGKRANPLGGGYVAAKFGMGAARSRVGGGGEGQRRPGQQHLPRRDRHADPGGPPQAVTEEQRALILKPEDVAEAILFVASLPPRVSIPELVIKPTAQTYW